MRIGTKVKFTRRNGEEAEGRTTTEEYVLGKGTWIDVNTGDKKIPKITKVRPSQLVKVK